MAGVASVGASAIYVCIAVGTIFMLWLCNYVFKPYIVKCFSKIYRTRVAMELDLLDTQKAILLNRLKRPPKIKRDPKTGSIIFEFWTPVKKITTENDEFEAPGRMKLADVVDLEFHKNELEKRLLEELLAVELEKQRIEKEEEMKLKFVKEEEAKRKAQGSRRRIKQRPPMPPNKLKRLRQMMEEERIREELLKRLNRVPTKLERIETGQANFKKHFLYHGKFIGWQLTTKQYNKIEKSHREHLYLQKHLGPFLHQLTARNVSTKDPLLPNWDDKTVVSERSSKKLKTGISYRPKVIRDYYTRLPPSEVQIIRTLTLTRDEDEKEHKLNYDLIGRIQNEIHNGTGNDIDEEIDEDRNSGESKSGGLNINDSIPVETSGLSIENLPV